MRKLMTAGLAALLLSAALTSHADAQRGRGRGGRSAKASSPGPSASWAKPNASKGKKRGGSAKKSVGVTNKLPNVTLPAGSVPGGGGRGGRRARGAGAPSAARVKRGGAPIKVDYNAESEKSSTPKCNRRQCSSPQLKSLHQKTCPESYRASLP